MSSDSAKLDQILEKLKSFDTLEGKIDGIDRKFGELNSTVTKLQASVTQHSNDIEEIRAELASYKAEVRTLKTAHNSREQRLRASTVRLFNFPVAIGESVDNYKPLAAKVYDRIIKPTLQAARAAGDIGSTPQQQNAIEACFRIAHRDPAVGSSSSPPPSPPIVIRLSSTAIKASVMKFRRSIPPPSEGEKNMGFRKFTLVEDLTPEAHSLLKALQGDSHTDKVWSMNGVIHFSLPGVTGFKKVRNIFDSVDTILGP